MNALVRFSLAATLAVTALPFARALPGFDSNAVKPAAGYAAVTPDPTNPLQVQITATRPGFGVFWVDVSSPDCAVQTQSIAPNLPWATHPDKSEAAWRTNTGPAGMMLVPPGTPGFAANPAFATFTAKAKNGCAVKTANVYLHVINLATGATFWAKPGGDAPPSCSQVLFFGRDPAVTTAVINDLLSTKGMRESDIDFVDTDAVYTPGALSAALDAKIARDGVPYCTMVFDSEYIGPCGLYSGLDALDQIRLQKAMLAGMGLVYLEPKAWPGYPTGQLGGILPLTLCETFTPGTMYTVTNPASPLAAGVPTPFNASSMGECGSIALLPVPDVNLANVTTVATAAADAYCAGGPTVLTLDYKPSAPSMLPGARVAILGTDPYPNNGVDFSTGPNQAALFQMIYNAILYTGQF